jgi:hypothetical protein
MRGRRARIRFLGRRWQIEAFLPRSLSASAQRADERTRTALLLITSALLTREGAAADAPLLVLSTILLCGDHSLLEARDIN